MRAFGSLPGFDGVPEPERAVLFHGAAVAVGCRAGAGLGAGGHVEQDLLGTLDEVFGGGSGMKEV
jgi:hypothetical protein